MATSAEPTGTFPEVQGGGSLIIAWQIKGKRVLVVGGGEVAAGRILHCLNADAHVTVVCPSSGLNGQVAHRVAMGQVRHINRVFEPSDLVVPPIPRGPDPASETPPGLPTPPPEWSSYADCGAASSSTERLVDMVLVAVDDPAASTSIWRLCRARRIPANIADVPSECDFYFGSVHRDGPLQVMVSTNGRGPRLAAQVRRSIAAGLPANAGGAIERVGRLRGMLRGAAPGPEEGPKRMGWMTKVSDTYGWEELCELTDEDMENLLRFYPENKVPSIRELKALGKDSGSSSFDVFDGSFGFSVGV